MSTARRSSLLAIAIFALSFPTLAADRYAIYRSEDRGLSWTQSDAGLPNEDRINAFASAAKTIVCGTDRGIYFSADNGKSWNASTIPSTGKHRIATLAVTTNNQTNILWAGAAEGSIFSSTDSGRTWQANSTFPARRIRSLLSLETNLYVGTDAAHVYKTSDHGQTWTQLAAGLPANSQVFSLTATDGRIFAGLYAQGLYTWNATDTWVQVGKSQNIHPLALASVQNTILAGHNPGGIYTSDDLGQTWKHWTLSDITLSLLAPIWELAADSTLALAGAGDGIFLSTDRGHTWTRAIDGLPASSHGIAFHIDKNLILASIHKK